LVNLDGCLAKAEDGTSMFVILWEFEVKHGYQTGFENAYGPQGPWVQLFRGDPRYRATQLLRDPARPEIYFTLDFWDSEPAYENFKKQNQQAYSEIESETESLTVNERLIGSFPMPE
jgi:heme-degrading monooxygenase HmoA